MEFVPVRFILERKSILPILAVTGKCKNVLGVKESLLGKTVEIIEFVQNHLNGKAIKLLGHEDDIGLKEGMIAVRFYLLFETDEQLAKAMKAIPKELG